MLYIYVYRKISNIRRTKYQNLNDPRLVLQLLLWTSWTQPSRVQYLGNRRFAVGEWPRIRYFYGKNVFSTNCKQAIKHNFTSVWLENLQNTQLNPLLRAYRTFKHEFAMEPYLYHVKKPKYRIAIAKFRCSSHIFEIERGRHTNPKTPVADRKCLHCNVIEDEKHFLLNCHINASERENFFHKVSRIDDRFLSLND